MSHHKRDARLANPMNAMLVASLVREAQASVRLDGETHVVEGYTPSPTEGTSAMSAPAHLPTTTITSAIVNVTPAQAQQWLNGNAVNRSLRPLRVAQYARAMTAGHWVITNDDICFAPDGTLLNGQHRLSAIVTSGQTIPLSIKWNVPREAMVHMDHGASRTLSDVLRMTGEAYGPALGALIRQVWLYENGLSGSTQINNDEALATLDAHPELRESVRATYRWRIDAPPTATGMTHWLIMRENGQEWADKFVEQVSTRVSEPAGSAIHALGNRIFEARRRRENPPIKHWIALFVRAWNHWATDNHVRTLSLAPGDAEVTIPPVRKIEEPAPPRAEQAEQA